MGRGGLGYRGKRTHRMTDRQRRKEASVERLEQKTGDKTIIGRGLKEEEEESMCGTRENLMLIVSLECVSSVLASHRESSASCHDQQRCCRPFP